MDKPAILKIERTHHLNHLTRVLPLIVAVFGVQCYVITQMSPETSIGNYALVLATLLTCLIGSMIFYDSYHSVLLYEDHMTVELKFFGQKRINYQEIKEILTTEDEVSFSSILFKMQDDKRLILHFVDSPKEVKNLIEKLKNDSPEVMAA